MLFWESHISKLAFKASLRLGILRRTKPFVPVKGNLRSTAHNDILDDSVLPTLWQQFGEGPFLLQHDNAPVHKARSMQKLSRSVWKNLTGLHGALTSTPSNTFGMNWNADCEPDIIAQHQLPDLTNALVAEWKQIPAAMFQNLVESLPRRVQAVIAAKGGPTPY